MIDLSALLPRGRNRFIDRLNWSDLIAPGVILCKDGSLLAGWRVTGLDTESMDPAALDVKTGTLAFRLSGLGDAHTIWSVFRRGPVRAALGEGPNRMGHPALDALAEEALEQLDAPGALWQGRLEMYLGWFPPPGERSLTKTLTAFAEECTRFESRIGPVFRATRLGPERTAGSEGEVAYCTLCAALAGLLGQDRRVATPKDGVPVALDVLLGADVVQPGRAGDVLRIDNRPLAVLSFEGWPAAFAGTPLDVIQSLEQPFAWVSRYDALSPRSARAHFEWRRKILRQSASDMMADVIGESEGRRGRAEDIMAEQIEETIAETGLGTEGHGFFTSGLLVLGQPGETRAALLPTLNALTEATANPGFTLREEVPGALSAYLSALPGHGGIEGRRVFMNASAFTSLIPVRSAWSGAAACPSPKLPPGTPPLALARSLTGELFRFNLHHGEVGHTLIFGPTGAGKSVLLGYLAANWLRYPDARVIFFDRGGSVRHACHGLGGTFVEPGIGGANGVAPLAHVAELGADWALGWLTELMRRGLGGVSVEQAQELRRAAQDMARSGAGIRILKDVADYVQDKDLRIALKAWSEGPRAGLFDHDGLDVNAALAQDGAQGRVEGGKTAALTVFETEALMGAREDVQVLTLDYIFAQVERRFDGPPTLVVLDEAWSFFAHGMFQERVKDWLKTGRKKKVAVVMATQSITDATGADITAHLLESCPTRIFLPNPEARGRLIAKDYAALGLSPGQIGLIARIEAKRDYYIRQPEGRRVLRFPLGPQALDLLARTGKDDSDRIAALIARASEGSGDSDEWVERQDAKDRDETRPDENTEDMSNATAAE